MKNKQPPFQITNKIIDDIAEISELTGRLSVHDNLSGNPHLRRTNRIRTIHGSLAIEQNTLSLEQVTAVLDGKHVLAPPKDIAEVKNAYEIYERLDELDPYYDPRTCRRIRHVPHAVCWRCRSGGTCPAFWHAAPVCARFGHGAVGLGKVQ